MLSKFAFSSNLREITDLGGQGHRGVPNSERDHAGRFRTATTTKASMSYLLSVTRREKRTMVRSRDYGIARSFKMFPLDYCLSAGPLCEFSGLCEFAWCNFPNTSILCGSCTIDKMRLHRPVNSHQHKSVRPCN